MRGKPKMTAEERGKRDEVREWLVGIVRSGVTARELSRISGKHYTHFGRVLSGERNPTGDMLAGIIARFGGAPETALQMAEEAKRKQEGTQSDTWLTALGEIESRVGLALRVVSAAQDFASVVKASAEHRVMSFLGEADGKEPNVQDAALRLLDALLAVPELADIIDPSSEREEAEELGQDDLASVSLEENQAKALAHVVQENKGAKMYPLVATASQRNPIAFVVDVKNDSVESRLNDLGIRHEWVEAKQSTGQRRIDGLAKRARRHTVCAVVIARGVASHRVFDKIKDAAKLGLVPLVAPKMVGVSGLDEALAELESKMKEDHGP